MEFSKLRNKLLFIPIGGNNEIGMNLNLYHYEGKWIMIDCGAGFADERIMPGIDIIVPNLSFILKNNIKIEGLIITHIHEDHIGAVPILWKSLKCPIYTTPFAAHFLKSKLSDYNLEDDVKIKVVTKNRGKFSIGSFDIEMIGLTHSTPEARAIYIKTTGGNIFHTGDWKLDPEPIVGESSDLERIEEIGKNKELTAIVCDSTNVFSENWSGSESSLEENLYNLVHEATGMVVITTFASNIARVKTIINVAKKCKRDIIASGSSLHRMLSIGQKIKYLETISVIDPKFFDEKRRSNTLVIATGCQGEPLATVAKLSGNTYPFFKLKKNDTVIFSSKIIPGNEKKIAATLNRLAQMDVKVITEKHARIHVSGHPHRDEIKYLYSLIKPKAVIPIHGEIMHINEHCQFAKNECNIKNTISVRNGYVIHIKEDGSLQKLGEISVDYFGVNGSLLHGPGSHVMRERRKMKNGVIICSFAVDKKLNVISDPKIHCLGSLDKEQDVDIIKNLEKSIIKSIKKKSLFSFLKGTKPSSEDKLEKLVKGLILSFFKKEAKIEPVIKVILLKV